MSSLGAIDVIWLKFKMQEFQIPSYFSYLYLILIQLNWYFNMINTYMNIILSAYIHVYSIYIKYHELLSYTSKYCYLIISVYKLYITWNVYAVLYKITVNIKLLNYIFNIISYWLFYLKYLTIKLFFDYLHLMLINNFVLIGPF